MSMTDPIADMLTRIRNALQANHDDLVLPSSRLKREISKILQGEGFIQDFRHEDDSLQGKLHIELRYGPTGERVINGIERVSRPGRRVYVGSREIPEVLGGMGITILSTSKGILDGRTARRLNVGGEWICNVW
ncbi:MAG: 30S ribosomal protein S8 [Acidobacteriota bacterium]|nr:30S ribosomal protein S8 [Acidobacteriota bacterium]